MYDNVIRPKAWLDFNDAHDQLVLPDSPHQVGARDTIKAMLLGALPEVLSHLLPKGKIIGRKFVTGNTAGERGDSLEVELYGDKAGVWRDNQDGERDNQDETVWGRGRSMIDAAVGGFQGSCRGASIRLELIVAREGGRPGPRFLSSAARRR